jgi:hypothetical protein
VADVAKQPDVSTPSDTQDCMAKRAALPRALMEGTAAMRHAGESYLPRETAESPTAYQNRLDRSVLFNAFGKTVEDYTGKVFAKPVVLQDDVPAQIVEWAENVDLTGRHINVFAKDVMMDGFQSGISFILVDMPQPVQRPDGQPATIADEKAAGIRPYLVNIPLEKLIGWKSKTVNGVETLTQIRISECVSEPDGEFHEKYVEQIRVIEPTAWRTFRQQQTNDGLKWVQYETGPNPLGKIALAVFYAKRTGFMTAVPPLEKLAELNVTHWQSASDQRTILHVARVPILFGAGIAEDTALTVGPFTMIRANDVGAKLQFVEHSGAAIEAGRNDLKDLEFQMQTMGLQLLIPDPGQSATGELRDDSKENSPLAMMATGLGDAIETAFGFMAEFAKLGKDGGSVEVNKDFGVQAGAAADAQWLLNAVNSGAISKETFWKEWQRRGILADDFDAETEKDTLKSEAPVLDGAPMDLGGPPGTPKPKPGVSGL